MPTETIVVVAGIILAFAVFAASLAWANFYTRGVRTPGATYFHEPSAESEARRPVIPTESGHPIRSKAATDSD
jgi:hypothetical protein